MLDYECKDGEHRLHIGKGGGAKLAEDLHSELLAQIPLGAPDNHVWGIFTIHRCLTSQTQAYKSI